MVHPQEQHLTESMEVQLMAVQLLQAEEMVVPELDQVLKMVAVQTVPTLVAEAEVPRKQVAPLIEMEAMAETDR
ncbi:hypothetical protein D9M72_328610 [compost metagenome]